MNVKVDLDALLFHALDFLRARGWDTGEITRQVPCDDMLPLRFRVKTLTLAMVAYKLLAEGQPMTLRGLFYRIVSAGWFPSTDKEHYQALGRVEDAIREYINEAAWDRMRLVEAAEQNTVRRVAEAMTG